LTIIPPQYNIPFQLPVTKRDLECIAHIDKLKSGNASHAAGFDGETIDDFDRKVRMTKIGVFHAEVYSVLIHLHVYRTSAFGRFAATIEMELWQRDNSAPLSSMLPGHGKARPPTPPTGGE
jgi:hypothetical protein